ncbi:MAG TPA: nitroreductase [Nitrospiraceae bacterium]|nr:MAG: nitroreductase [Nitrospirae bacterium GWA2_46_11]OGW26143.1 MAG: nitroreductase [Nitrospirae bacterium GWB2_47_37]HAK89398.1 nitroreductase [Nitrospiraceae bacterium]HCZ12321.1 nitroreductase [Nitrospiraceae bacterium]
MDSVLKVIKDRRSIRNFQKKDIPDDVIKKLIDALIWAPSAGNFQSRKFYFVRDEKTKRDVAIAALNQNFIAEAPLVVIGCADRRVENRYGDRGIHLYAVQDVACSIMNMMLVACENDLGSVWVGAFRESEVFEALDLPNHLRPVAIVPIGYPSRMPAAPPRVSVKEAVEFR